mmetsp:Transcript_123561/g.384651  ORF Transcript_123561/g.384651 Transcript_123561/m.384651 type:complete len:292 (+) Transcript_123561:371-1246(+)
MLRALARQEDVDQPRGDQGDPELAVPANFCDDGGQTSNPDDRNYEVEVQDVREERSGSPPCRPLDRQRDSRLDEHAEGVEHRHDGHRHPGAHHEEEPVHQEALDGCAGGQRRRIEVAHASPVGLHLRQAVGLVPVQKRLYQDHQVPDRHVERTGCLKGPPPEELIPFLRREEEAQGKEWRESQCVCPNVRSVNGHVPMACPSHQQEVEGLHDDENHNRPHAVAPRRVENGGYHEPVIGERHDEPDLAHLKGVVDERRDRLDRLLWPINHEVLAHLDQVHESGGAPSAAKNL